jgi:hypothetical protein
MVIHGYRLWIALWGLVSISLLGLGLAIMVW